MKLFKLRLRGNSAHGVAKTAGKHPSIPSLSTSVSSRQPKHVTNVESWNELRKIGSERKQPKGLNAVLKGNHNDVTLQEVQDWDYYIAEFNEQYRQQMKQQTAEQDKDSISTIADSKSQLFRSRHRRMLVYRKCFIFSCLLLWLICFVGAHQWYLTYLIYPVGFLEEIDHNFFTSYFTPKAVWLAFVLNSHSWTVGCFGLLCSFCFREKPAVLRQFILRVPAVLIVPSGLMFIAVRFVGTFSSQKLKLALNKKIPEYHDNTDPNVNFNGIDKADSTGKRLWDQLQKILACCGVDGTKDWDSVDNDVTDEASFWPETCCPKPFIRRTWTKERPDKDDCYYKINKKFNTNEYEWAYPDGCLNLAYEFFVKLGAIVVGVMVGNFCALCLCLTFGFKYYTMIRKCEELKFKYTWKQWFADILFLRYFTWIPRYLRKCFELFKKPSQKPQDPDPKQKNKSFASGNLSQASQVSGESGTSIMLGGHLRQVPSVIVTAPGNEEDDGENMHVVFAADPQEQQILSSAEEDGVHEERIREMLRDPEEAALTVVNEKFKKKPN